MDAEFDKRWRDSRAPFDGQTVTLGDYVDLSLLQKALVAVVDRLYCYRPEASLFRLSDWHEHDGIVLEAKPSSWEELRSLVAFADSLAACFRGADTLVREGFFPVERDYYLRLYVRDPHVNLGSVRSHPLQLYRGIFDVTCQQTLATEIAAAIRAAGIVNVVTLPAKAFFDDRFSG